MSDDLLNQICSSPKLPSMPAIAVQFLELAESPDADITEIAGLVARDPAISARVLRVANSAAYGQMREVSTLSRALMVMGVRTAKTLVAGFSLAHGMQQARAKGLDHEDCWRRSLVAAAVSKELAIRAGIDAHEEAFLGGLLHSVGLLAMAATLSSRYVDLLEASGGCYRTLRILERECFGFDHAKLAGAMADRWNLPVQLAQPLTHFGRPELAPAGARPLSRCIALAALAAEALCSPKSTEAAALFKHGCETGLGLSSGDIAAALEATQNEATSLMTLFDVSATTIPDTWKILQRANEMLVDANLEAQTEILELHDLAMSDGLTGLANRRRFDAFLAEQCHLAARLSQPLSLLLIDLDHFKGVNDTYGHQAGDRVLAAVAETLVAHVRSSDLVARYGGEEFVVVSPGNTDSGALALADRLRTAIGALEIPHQALTIRTTASVGVAFATGATAPSPSGLLTDADGALYAAKAMGRDVVRIVGDRAA